MWNKIKEFFKKFWYVILVPVGLFIGHLFVGSSDKYKEKEKAIKKDVKEDKKEIEKTKKEVEKKEKKVKETVEKTEEIIEEDVKDKAVRDEKASKYLPNL